MFVEARLSIDDLAFFSPSPFLSLHPILSLSLCARSENFLLEDDVSELTRPIPNVGEIKTGEKMNISIRISISAFQSFVIHESLPSLNLHAGYS